MRRILLVAISVSTFSVLAIADRHDRSRDRWPLSPLPIKAKAQRPLPRLEDPALPVHTVQPLPSTQGPTLLLHQKLAERLSGVNVIPDERRRHFRWLDNGDFELQGWHGFIEQANPIPGGYLVTLQVSPYVRSRFGASTTILDSLSEKYEVMDDRVRYVGAIPSPVVDQPSFVVD